MVEIVLLMNYQPTNPNTMTNTKKRLEFESFDSFFAGLSIQDEKNAMKLYEKYIQAFLASKIAQARAEERERVRKVIRNMPAITRSEAENENCVNMDDLLSSLDKPDK